MDDLWNYIRQVRRPDPDNFFTTNWGGCLIRNVGEDGILVSCSSQEKYKKSKIPMWVSMYDDRRLDSSSGVKPSGCPTEMRASPPNQGSTVYNSSSNLLPVS